MEQSPKTPHKTAFVFFVSPSLLNEWASGTQHSLFKEKYLIHFVLLGAKNFGLFWTYDTYRSLNQDLSEMRLIYLCSKLLIYSVCDYPSNALHFGFFMYARSIQLRLFFLLAPLRGLQCCANTKLGHSSCTRKPISDYDI